MNMKTIINSLLKNTGKRGIAIVIVCVLVFGGMVSYAAFSGALDVVENGESTIDEIITESVAGEIEYKKNMQMLKIEREQELQAEADSIELDSAIDAKLKDADIARLDHGYRRMLAEKDIPDKQREMFELRLVNSSDPQTALVLFDYLHDNYFTFDDLDKAIEGYESGESVETILQRYVDIEMQRQAKDYAEGAIDDLIKNRGLSLEDLRIAEIIEAHSAVELNMIVEKLSVGESWEDIAAEFNLLNGTGIVKSVMLSEDDIIACSEALGISEEQSAKRLSIIQKTGMGESAAEEYVTSNVTVTRVIKESVESKLTR